MGLATCQLNESPPQKVQVGVHLRDIITSRQLTATPRSVWLHGGSGSIVGKLRDPDSLFGYHLIAPYVSSTRFTDESTFTSVYKGRALAYPMVKQLPASVRRALNRLVLQPPKYRIHQVMVRYRLYALPDGSINEGADVLVRYQDIRVATKTSVVFVAVMHDDVAIHHEYKDFEKSK